MEVLLLEYLATLQGTSRLFLLGDDVLVDEKTPRNHLPASYQFHSMQLRLDILSFLQHATET